MAVNEYEIKKQICDIGKRIYDHGTWLLPTMATFQ